MITVGIPTYNRAQAVAQTVIDFARDCERERVQTRGFVPVIVSDNFSSDDTVERLKNVQRTIYKNLDNHAGLTVLTNTTNAGFQGNILRLLDACQTEYLMLWSDEDTVSASALFQIEEALTDRPCAFVSPRFSIGGRTYRGRRREEKIKPTQCQHAAGYVSGLVVSAKVFRRHRNLFVSSGCFSSRSVYPQVEVLQGFLALGYEARWLPAISGAMREHLPSKIATEDGSAFWQVSGRVEQVKRAEDWLSELSRTVGDSGQVAVDEMIHSLPLDALKLIQKALMLENSKALRESSRQLNLLLRMHPERIALAARRRFGL